MNYLKRNSALILCMVSVALSFFYLFRESLWLDEAALAYNILVLSFGDLGKELAYGQMAPIGYLCLLKTFSLFVNDDLLLRFLPYSVFLGFMVFYLINYRKTPFYTILLLTICSSSLFILYTSEVKQYFFDVATLLLWYVIYHEKSKFILNKSIFSILVKYSMTTFRSSFSL